MSELNFSKGCISNCHPSLWMIHCMSSILVILLSHNNSYSVWTADNGVCILAIVLVHDYYPHSLTIRQIFKFGTIILFVYKLQYHESCTCFLYYNFTDLPSWMNPHLEVKFHQGTSAYHLLDICSLFWSSTTNF